MIAELADGTFIKARGEAIEIDRRELELRYRYADRFGHPAPFEADADRIEDLLERNDGR